MKSVGSWTHDFKCLNIANAQLFEQRSAIRKLTKKNCNRVYLRWREQIQWGNETSYLDVKFCIWFQNVIFPRNTSKKNKSRQLIRQAFAKLFTTRPPREQLEDTNSPTRLFCWFAGDGAKTKRCSTGSCRIYNRTIEEPTKSSCWLDWLPSRQKQDSTRNA